MNIKYLLFGSLFISLLLLSCSSQKGLTVEGQLNNASNLSVFFDKKDLNNTITSLEKVDASQSGSFEFNFPEGISPGIYRVRLGAKTVDLVLDGTEKNINISGDLQNLQNFNYNIEGAPLAETYRSTMKDYLEQKLNPQSISNTINAVDPLVAMTLANTIYSGNPQMVATHKSICERLSAKYPGVECTKDYESMIKGLENSMAKNQASKGRYKVNVGDVAPDIALPDLNGKVRKLSDLKGQIVLIDFWASWCGPCRKANPGVVETYKKYKDQGFTVFSVSLDGLDQRTKQRLGNKADVIEKQMISSKKRWADAIKHDKLEWKNHVSDLKKWDSKASALYGVRSIPTTFMVDRDGTISALNPRHAQIEIELKKLL